MPGIVDIIRGAREEMERLAPAAERFERALAGATREAAAAADIEPRRAPITDASRLLPASTGGGGLGTGTEGVVAGGGLPTGGAGVLAGSDTARPEGARLFRNRAGMIQTEEWVMAHCAPVEVDVSSGGGSVRRRMVWQCPMPYGDMVPTADAEDLSLSSSGGVGQTRRSGARFPGRAFGRGISGSTAQGRTEAAAPQEAQGGGIDRLTGGLTARQDRTNQLLENIDRKLSGDGGAGLRAGGLI